MHHRRVATAVRWLGSGLMLAGLVATAIAGIVSGGAHVGMRGLFFGLGAIAWWQMTEAMHQRAARNRAAVARARARKATAKLHASNKIVSVADRKAARTQAAPARPQVDEYAARRAA